jgi:hypothetical protein
MKIAAVENIGQIEMKRQEQSGAVAATIIVEKILDKIRCNSDFEILSGRFAKTASL